jgi:hypothetical protein
MPYIGKEPANSFISFEKQVFTIVNSQTAYTLDNAVTNENDIRLVINNIVQEPGSGKAYTASGTTLTLSAALVNGTDEMYCVFLGKAVQTVNTPNASVGTSQLASDAVTAAKLNDDIISGQTALGATPADTDEFLVSDAGTIKRVDYSYIKGLANWSESSGNLLPSNASYGIYLGVNSATAANLLDDYEEGTWTPQLKISGATTGIVYGTQAGHYTKIGNRVIASAEILLSNKGSNTGNVSMIGLPFTTSNDNYQNASTYNDRVSSPNGDVQVFLLTNSTTASIYQSRTDGTNNGNLTGSEMNNDSYLVMFMTYKTG